MHMRSCALFKFLRQVPFRARNLPRLQIFFAHPGLLATLIVSSTVRSTAHSERESRQKKGERSESAKVDVEAGVNSGPATAAKSSELLSPLQGAVFLRMIDSSQPFSVGGLGNTEYSVQEIGRALKTKSIGQLSWFLAAYALCGGLFV